MTEQFEPTIIGFTCNWCSYRAADLAGTARLKYPPNIRLIRLMCSGRLDPSFVFKALAKGADGVMIGRGALGRPWLFRDIDAALRSENADEQKLPRSPSPAIRHDIILRHLEELYQFYGKERGVRVGRKHLSWYCKYLEGARHFRDNVVRLEEASDQFRLTRDFLRQSA